MSKQHALELETQLELLKQDGNTKFKEIVEQADEERKISEQKLEATKSWMKLNELFAG